MKLSSVFMLKIRAMILSGFNSEPDAESLQNIIIPVFISAACVLFMSSLGVVAVAEGNVALGIFDFSASLILIGDLVYLKMTNNYRIFRIVGLFVAGILFYYLLITGGVNNTAHLWFFTFPMFATFLLGSKNGGLATLLLFLFAMVFFALDLDYPFLTHYSNDFIIRFIPSFFVTTVFAFGFEYVREQKQKELNQINKELEHAVTEQITTANHLRLIKEELEQRVMARTQELTEANRELKKEIETRKRSERERLELEKQLAHAQKMEAIGTLAGGVAHDLNNVLGASVSLPDLMLMDLPEGSRMKKLLLTIKKSGLRASAIVNDLLMLARRGHTTLKAVNLNSVITSHLDSPEHMALLKFHPEVHIQHDLDKELFNINGSAIHLTKAIMNLLSNAAEATMSGGTIRIATANEYVDKDMKGKLPLDEGDYVVLRVSDTGRGIPKENLKRIFEPFFTNKKLGRSGTGLGMAVVWGTVQDHAGTIDIESIEGQGTTFSIYFPITRMKCEDRKAALPLSDYSGHGESILVIDDVELQRTIASGILSKLRYNVSTVSSGEQAIETLRKKQFDLLIIDMIMDPGIDGLETYRRILTIRPKQKAIIASGFSVSDRVKEIQRLGARTYIKKPYTVEKMGVAVYQTLHTTGPVQ